MEKEEVLKVYRHSLAHIMAKAVIELYGKEVQYAIGPEIDDGCYYDFVLPRTVTEEDFPAIEEKMHEIIKRREDWTRKVISKSAPHSRSRMFPVLTGEVMRRETSFRESIFSLSLQRMSSRLTLHGSRKLRRETTRRSVQRLTSLCSVRQLRVWLTGSRGAGSFTRNS